MKRSIVSKALFSLSKTINPATGEVFRTHNAFTQKEINACTKELWSSYTDFFRDMAWAERAEYLNGVRDNLDRYRDDAAKIMSLEMGKPILQSYSEVDKCLNLMDFFIEEGESMLNDINEPYGIENTKIAFEPIGIVFQLAPFNFPFWQVVRFCFPALATGNVILVRHSHSCPENGLLLEKIFHVEGFPGEVYKNVVCTRSDVKNLVEDRRVRGLAFTGSSDVGRKVAMLAGENLTKSVLELGGSDAFIVMDDADVESACQNALLSRVLINTGQSCNAAKRILVQSGIKDAFLKRMTVLMEEVTFGDPFDENNAIGPLAREDLRDELYEQVKKGVKDGAQLIVGGNVPDSNGFFFEPTLISNVSPENTSLFVEETFGPAMCVTEFGNADGAIRLANMSEYGLSGAVFTQDLELGEYMARHLEVGLGYVNRCAASHWALPFGGFPGKSSGYGRECGFEGLKEWCNIKTLML